jgi:hypothetical protein
MNRKQRRAIAQALGAPANVDLVRFAKRRAGAADLAGDLNDEVIELRRELAGRTLSARVRRAFGVGR